MAFPTFLYNENNEERAKITLKGEIGEVVFPVLPEELEHTHSVSHTKVSVVGGGEVVVMGDSTLEEVSFSSFFWAADPVSESMFNYFGSDTESNASIKRYGRNELNLMFNRLLGFALARKPLKMTIEGLLGSWGEKQVVITKFDFRHKGGDPDAIHFDITLLEYKPPQALLTKAVSA